MPNYADFDALINAGKYQEAWNNAASQGIGATDIASHVNSTFNQNWTPNDLLQAYAPNAPTAIGNQPDYMYQVPGTNEIRRPAPTQPVQNTGGAVIGGTQVNQAYKQAPVSNLGVGQQYAADGGMMPGQSGSGLEGQMNSAYSRLMSGQVDNPYLSQQATALQGMSNQNLMQNIMPQINSGAVGAGQYGGSRQGIAQGVAAGNAQTGLDNSIASLYGNAYNTAQGNMLQGANSYGNLSNQSANLGFNMANTSALTNDTLQNNALNRSLALPTWQLNALGTVNGMYNQSAGQGGTASTPYTSNALASGLGGAATVAGLIKNLGF